MPALASRVRLTLIVAGLVLAAKVLPGCGSSSGGQAAGVDASSATDGSGTGDGTEGAAALVDGAGPSDAGSLDGPIGDGAAGGGSWLDGSMAFSVSYALLVPQNLMSCGYAPSPATGYGDFVVIMTDVDLSSGCDGGTFTGFPDAGAGHPFVRIEVKSPSYGTDGGALISDGGPVAPIGPGVYPIGFDNWTTDVCMLAGTDGLALIDDMRFTDNACCSTVTGEALSGAVTLTTLDQGHVVGSFQISLAPQDGGVAGSAPLSGYFNATTCPGTKQ